MESVITSGRSSFEDQLRGGWVSNLEIGQLAFESERRPEFRVRLTALLLRRAEADIVLCCDVNRGAQPEHISRRTGIGAELTERSLRWIRNELPVWALRQDRPEVATGSTQLSCTTSPDPCGRLVHFLVLAWRNRDCAPGVLVLGRLETPFDTPAVSAAGSSVWTIALAESSLPCVDPAVRINPTPRERQIMELVSKGLTNAEVARLCSLSKFTVRNQLSKMFERFGATNRTELTQLFWENRGALGEAPQPE